MLPRVKNGQEYSNATVRAMLNAAQDDGVIFANPANRLGKALRLVRSKATRQEEIKAFDRRQLSTLLGGVLATAPRLYPLFLTMARSGLRIGEALALQWDDLDFAGREMRVERAVTNAGDLGTPKSGRGRTVDMSMTVKDTLQRHQTRLAESWLKRKAKKDENGHDLPKGVMPPWVFPSDEWTVMDHANIGKAFKRILKAAGLPMHHSPHSLRHTFASILLQQEESIQHVQRMLGHASITLTVDTYGKWLPMGKKAAVDGQEDQDGVSLVSEATNDQPDDSQVVDVIGDPGRARTFNPEIKSLRGLVASKTLYYSADRYQSA
jgi:integrase